MPIRTILGSDLSFSSPLVGEDGRVSGQEGGAPKASRRAKLAPWSRNAPGRSDAIRPKPRSGFGGACGHGRSTAFSSDVRRRSAPTSSTSCVSPASSSSRWMAGNTPGGPNSMRCARRGRRVRAFTFCGFGTTRCWRIRTASCRRSNRWFWVAARRPLSSYGMFGSCFRDAFGVVTPTPPLPHQGGGSLSVEAGYQFPPPLWGRVRVGGVREADRGDLINPQSCRLTARQARNDTSVATSASNAGKGHQSAMATPRS